MSPVALAKGGGDDLSLRSSEGAKGEPISFLKHMFENAFLNALAIFGARDLIFVMAVVVMASFFVLPKQKQKQMILFAAFLFPVAYLAAKLGSLLFFNARPFAVGGFDPLLPHDADNGFPSDHSLLAAAFVAVALPYKKWGGMILAILAFFVGISRVYVGVHHPIDILASFLIVAVVAPLVFKAIRST